MPGMRLLSIGDRVHPGAYKIHSRFDRVVNFTYGGYFVSLVEKEIGGGPLNIVIKDVNLNGVRDLEVDRGSVVLNKRRFYSENDLYYRSDMDFEHLCVETFYQNLTILERLLIETSHPKSLAFLLDERRIEYFHSGFERAFVKQITGGVQKIYNGNIINGVEMLKGCGFGLTPSGDDFLSGLLIGLNFIQMMFGENLSVLIDTIYDASRGGNIFSNTFLYLAKEGLLFERFKKLIAVLIYGEDNEILQCTESLFSVGGSSGADLVVGFLMTVQSELPDSRPQGTEIQT